MSSKVNDISEKIAEMKYHDTFIGSHGCYELYPDEEYLRILSMSGILSETPSLVLDVGCGSGAFGFRLAKRGFSVVGVDISPESIKAAKRLAKRQGFDADFVVGDIEKMPFHSKSFPLVFCGCVLHHLPDKTGSIVSGLNYILNNGGKLFLCEPNALNVGCFVNYHFGKDRTSSEHALNPKHVVGFLSPHFSNIHVMDIGDVKNSSFGEVGFLRRAVRRFLKLFFAAVGKLPFVPGPFFVISANKRDLNEAS